MSDPIVIPPVNTAIFVSGKYQASPIAGVVFMFVRQSKITTDKEGKSVAVITIEKYKLSEWTPRGVRETDILEKTKDVITELNQILSVPYR